ncbi:MAG: hypothetical protein WC256_10280 [Desulfurivibrionaceae bacterium]|jgi:hypothetical protein
MEATKQEARTDSQNQSSTPMLKKFLGVKSFSEKHPEFSQASLRWLIFHRESNGFAPVFRKVGKKVLIDETAFFSQIDNSTMGA